ncbi:SRPBCC domain-containing protein [Actinomycetospora rhizophila]|uniref:SRPBCC domain-containing protein n=1 Tax=Actinomycetospora rhizophila TaxID=1416876 RepID=A0ABV9ZLE5_9PSEU
MTEQDPRTVDLEVTVPGTPEQVWDAIATGPGVSSWLHPTRVGEYAGGEFAFDMGSGFSDGGTVTAYDAPERFATEATWPAGEETTTLATEWLVSTRDEGTCVVGMVMSGFGTGDDWDGEIDALREGMGLALETLRVYLTHFAGRRSATVAEGARLGGSQPDAWQALLAAAGLADARVGDHVTLDATPGLAGTVTALSPGEHLSGVVLHLDAPAPGIADLATAGGHATVHLSLFDDAGTDAAALADREGPRWRTWLEEIR